MSNASHPGSSHDGMMQGMQECIDLCGECREICTRTVTHCLEMGGRHADAEHIALLLDCADICSTSGSFMLRHSGHHRRVCDVCAAVCRACAESCRSIGADDAAMKACADVCDRCAESCARMASAAA